MKLSLVILTVLVASTTLSRADDPKKPGHGGFSVNVHDGQVDIDGLGDYIDDQIDAAMDRLDDANVPKELRDKVKARLGKLRAKLRHMDHLDAKDLDQLGKELGQMGDELGKELGQDFGRQFGKDLAKHWMQYGPGNVHVHVDSGDDDDDDSDVDVPDVDDDGDLADTVRSIGDLKLTAPQRQAIEKLRADSDKQVAAAQQALAQASKKLHDQLANPATSDAELARSVDAVSQQEAAIRKARILAWHAARRLLDDAQRKKVESAVGKGK